MIRWIFVPCAVVLLLLMFLACSSDSGDDLLIPTTSAGGSSVATATPISPIPTSGQPALTTPSLSSSPTPASIPVAVIEAITPNPVYVNQEVTFRGSGSDALAGIHDYRWSIEGYGAIAYKDAFSSTVVTRSPGTYMVLFEVQNNIGVWSPRVQQELTVLAIPPSANFRAAPVFGNVPLSVDFTDISSREIARWAWDFGDGETSSEPNPTHVYTSAGTYAVSLVVEGPTGADTEIKTDIIETVDIDFTADVIDGHRPLEVRFTDESKGDIASWSWNFGEGQTSTDQHPTHVYNTAGVYDVTLTVISSSGPSAAESRTHYIIVLEPAPVADFYTHPTVHANALEQFTDFSTGIITSWLWDFGDGYTSTEQNPFHIYTAPGTYVVRLVVQGPGGADIQQRSILVEAL